MKNFEIYLSKFGEYKIGRNVNEPFNRYLFDAEEGSEWYCVRDITNGDDYGMIDDDADKGEWDVEELKYKAFNIASSSHDHTIDTEIALFKCTIIETADGNYFINEEKVRGYKVTGECVIEEE